MLLFHERMGFVGTSCNSDNQGPYDLRRGSSTTRLHDKGYFYRRQQLLIICGPRSILDRVCPQKGYPLKLSACAAR